MKHPMTLAAVAALAIVAAALSPVGAGAQDQAGTEGIGIPEIALDEVAMVDDPIAMATRKGTNDLYVAERGGVVRRLVPNGDDFAVRPTPVVDISAQTGSEGEQGLLGLAFNPAGTKLYLHYDNNAGNTRIVEYRMNNGGSGNRVIAGSRRLVFAVHQPDINHNGGTIMFGRDNRLYIALGDGGGAGDPRGNGQNLRTVLGKVLRINPNPGRNSNFTSPADNPFQRPRKRPIWLYGVRNPWRISFDRATGDLYVADVGQNQIEELTVLPANAQRRNAGRGANLGWRRMEGSEPFQGRTEPGNHTPPTFEYQHAGGRCTIIGGYVYRGAIAEYDGVYFFGDFCSGELGYVEIDANHQVSSSEIDIGQEVPPFTLQSFGQDRAGEVYVLTSDGKISRIEEGF